MKMWIIRKKKKWQTIFVVGEKKRKMKRTNTFSSLRGLPSANGFCFIPIPSILLLVHSPHLSVILYLLTVQSLAMEFFLFFFPHLLKYNTTQTLPRWRLMWERYYKIILNLYLVIVKTYNCWFKWKKIYLAFILHQSWIYLKMTGQKENFYKGIVITTHFDA